MNYKRRILITGAYGFVGQAVTERLWAKDENCPNYIISLPGKATHDLRQPDRVIDIIDNTRPDVIIHLAANCGGIGLNQRVPFNLGADNLKMGINIIEGALYANAKLILVSTCCEYPKHSSVPFKEERIYDGFPEETNAMYGMAKKTIRLLAESAYKQFGLNVINLVPANMYGPNDNFDPQTSHVIPALIRKIDDAVRRKLETIELWGSGSATRDFLYAADLARAIENALDCSPGPEPINIGTGVETSINAVASIIAEEFGWNGVFTFDDTKPDGQPRRCLDAQRAAFRLNFAANTDLCTGLERTIDWYRNQNRFMEKHEPVCSILSGQAS